jgi:hypothetical protein
MENAVRRAESAEEATREAKADIAYLDKMIREQFQFLTK